MLTRVGPSPNKWCLRWQSLPRLLDPDLFEVKLVVMVFLQSSGWLSGQATVSSQPHWYQSLWYSASHTDLLERSSYLDYLCLQFYSLQYTWVKCMVQVSPVAIGKMKEIGKRFQAPAEFVAHLWCGTLMPHCQRHWKLEVPACQRVLLVLTSAGNCNTVAFFCKLHVY